MGGGEGVQATSLESRVQECLLPETQRAHCNTGTWPSSTVWRDYDIGIRRKYFKKQKQPHIVQMFPTASP